MLMANEKFKHGRFQGWIQPIRFGEGDFSNIW